MPKGMDDAVRAYQLPQTGTAIGFVSQVNLSSNAPVYITPCYGGSGGGELPQVLTGSAHFDITITHYLEQAAVEAREQ